MNWILGAIAVCVVGVPLWCVVRFFLYPQDFSTDDWPDRL